MSTRILNNNNMNQIGTATITSNLPRPSAFRTNNSPSDLRRVKKALFNCEPQDTSTQNFVQDELLKLRTTMSEKWNFNFALEETLNPNGAYVWRPVTPPQMIRPVKRRPSSEFDDNSELYGNPIYIRPVKPIPIKLVPQQSAHQSLITDFMTSKRPRSTTNEVMVKKLEVENVRPAKIPRLADFS